MFRQIRTFRALLHDDTRSGGEESTISLLKLLKGSYECLHCLTGREISHHHLEKHALRAVVHHQFCSNFISASVDLLLFLLDEENLLPKADARYHPMVR